MITLELAFYFYLCALACVSVFLSKKNKTVLYFFAFFNFFIFSLIVRNSGFDADIKNYEQALNVKSFSIYYLKEPLYWLGSRVIFELSESPIIVFVFYDFIFFTMLFCASIKLKLPVYFPFIALLFFPSVLGMQNVLRQFIASGFLLMFVAFVFSGSKFRLKLLALIFAALAHNSALLFAPIIFLRKSGAQWKKLFFFSAVAVIALLPVAASTKSSSNTGDLPPYLYFIIFTALIFIYLLILRFNFKAKRKVFREYFWMLMYLWGLIFMAMLVMGGAQSKRLGMLSLLLSLIPLITLIEFRFKQRVLIRLLFVIVLVLPTVMFNNSKNFLETASTQN